MFIPPIKPITRKHLKSLQNQRNKENYIAWRNYCLARDEYKCQWPGCKEVDNLEIHHIKKFAKRKDLRVQKYNGITLCKEHHLRIFNYEERYELLFFNIVNNNQKKYDAKKDSKDNS